MVTIFSTFRRPRRKLSAKTLPENQPCGRITWPGIESPGHGLPSDSLKKFCLVLLTIIVIIAPDRLCFAGENADPYQTNNPEANVGKQNESNQYDMVTADYAIPDVSLTDANGKAVSLIELLKQSRPVLLQFIYTSCSTVCPLLSVTFAQIQREMAREKLDCQLISISIDPEFDTAERLANYAKKFHASNNWLFLTGRKDDIRRVLTAFDAIYQSDNKTYHRSLLYLHSAPDQPWTRFEGFIDAHDLMNKMQTALKPA